MYPIHVERLEGGAVVRVQHELARALADLAFPELTEGGVAVGVLLAAIPYVISVHRPASDMPQVTHITDGVDTSS